MQHLSAKDVQRKHGQERKARRDHRSRQRLVDALVHDLAQRRATHELQVLADAVENNDGVVHRVTDQRQDRGDHRQSDLLVRQREKADGDQRVVEDSDHSSRSIDELKAEPQVHQHPDQRPQHGPTGLPRQLLARGGTDGVSVLDLVTGLVIVRRKCIHHGLPGVVARRVGALRQRDELFIPIAAAEALQAGVVNARLVQHAAQVIFIGLRVKRHAHLRAALKVNAHRHMVPEQHAQNAGDREDQ